MHFKNVRLNEFREIAKDEMWKLKKQKQKKPKNQAPKVSDLWKEFQNTRKNGESKSNQIG